MQKANLTRALDSMQKLFPDQFDFYPKTWFLPEQRSQFEKDVRSIHESDRRRKRRLTTFIVKPSGSIDSFFSHFQVQIFFQMDPKALEFI